MLNINVLNCNIIYLCIVLMAEGMYMNNMDDMDDMENSNTDPLGSRDIIMRSHFIKNGGSLQ